MFVQIKKSASRFKRNIKWQFIANAAQAVLGGLYLLVLGRYLGAADFGVFSTILAIVSVTGLLFDLRLQDVVAKEMYHLDDIESDEKNEGIESKKILDLFALECVSRGLPSIGLLIFSSIFITYSNLPEGSDYLIGIAAIGFFLSKTGWSSTTGLLRVLGRTDLIALCLSVDWGLRLIVTTILSVVIGLDILTALIVALLAGGVSNILQMILATREFKKRVSPISIKSWNIKEAISRLKKTRRLIFSGLGISISDLMAKDLDVAMISSYLTADKVGIYKMSKSFVQVIWRAIDPFYIAIMPEIQKLWAQERYKTLRHFLTKSAFWLLIAAIFLVSTGYFAVLIFGERILGSDFSGLPDLMLLMSAWIIVCAPLIWGHPLAVAVNRPEIAVYGGVLGTVVGITFFLILTPVMGLYGAAISWVLTLIVGVVFTAATTLIYAVKIKNRNIIT